MPFSPSDLLWFGALPLAIGALVMFLASRFDVRPTAAWSTSVAAGCVAGMFAAHARAGWQSAIDHFAHPRSAIDWLPWLVMLAVAIATLAAYSPRTWQRGLLVLAFAFTIAVPLRLLATNAAAMARWTSTEKLAILAFCTVAYSAFWLTLSLGRRNGQPFIRSTLLIVVALGTAITLAASGSFAYFELGLITTTALLGATAIAFILKESPSAGPSSAAGPITIMLLSLILLGYTYELTATNAALLTLALAASAGYLPLPTQATADANTINWPALAIRATLTFVPLFLAAASAISAATANPYG